jgi:hypothetical protein
MRGFVNLSSRPFRNRRLFWLAILLAFLIPSYFGLQAIVTLTQLETEITGRDAVIKKLKGDLGKIQKPAGGNFTISIDQNHQLVAANELVARRAFSWSQLLNDIERNLPGGVRVLRVAVTQIQSDEQHGGAVNSGAAATLNMTVVGKGGTEVTTMINKFHESGRFKVSPVSKKVVEGTDDVEFELKVEYQPPLHATRAGLGNQIAEKK